MRRATRLALGLVVAGATACVRTPARPAAVATPVRETPVRVALFTAAPEVTLSATGDWRLQDARGVAIGIGGSWGDRWRVQAASGEIRATIIGGATYRATSIVARSIDPAAVVAVNGKRYRGEVLLTVTDSGLLVVNRLPLEMYLRGVVPLEIGERSAEEQAAVDAQAVAARSYTVARLAQRAVASPAPYDLIAAAGDQVYGGMDAESRSGDAAVARTAGLVLLYGGRVIEAVYHAVCGGSTADAQELWQTTGQPYLQRVSDRIPGTDRYYCDISPRFAWSRTLDAKALAAAVTTYLPSYAEVRGDVGTLERVEVVGRTPSGRAASVAFVTNRGRYVVRGNNVRYVLRAPGGDILNSTSLEIESRLGRDGALLEVMLHGTGNGHGVGMCQWGAIGRARAGQDFRTILRTYFPGTEVGPGR